MRCKECNMDTKYWHACGCNNIPNGNVEYTKEEKQKKKEELLRELKEVL